MKRVLFVDDEEGILEALEFFKGQFGTRLLFARSVRDAMEILKVHEIELVIAEATLPGGKGRDLHQFLLSQRPSARFVYYTDVSSADLPEQERSARLYARPDDKKHLVRLIQSVLRSEAA